MGWVPLVSPDTGLPEWLRPNAQRADAEPPLGVFHPDTRIRSYPAPPPPPHSSFHLPSRALCASTQSRTHSPVVPQSTASKPGQGPPERPAPPGTTRDAPEAVTPCRQGNGRGGRSQRHRTCRSRTAPASRPARSVPIGSSWRIVPACWRSTAAYARPLQTRHGLRQFPSTGTRLEQASYPQRIAGFDPERVPLDANIATRLTAHCASA